MLLSLFNNVDLQAVIIIISVDIPYRAPGVSTSLGFVNGIPVRHKGIMNFSQSRETPVNQNKTSFNIHNISKNVCILKCYLAFFQVYPQVILDY